MNVSQIKILNPRHQKLQVSEIVGCKRKESPYFSAELATTTVIDCSVPEDCISEYSPFSTVRGAMKGLGCEQMSRSLCHALYQIKVSRDLIAFVHLCHFMFASWINKNLCTEHTSALSFTRILQMTFCRKSEMVNGMRETFIFCYFVQFVQLSCGFFNEG